MRNFLHGFVLAGVLAGCSSSQPPAVPSPGQAAASVATSRPAAPVARMTPGIADLPDQGALVAYERGSAVPVAKGAFIWHPVRLSEEHALHAVVGGELVVAAPDGRPIRLRYDHHVEHPDGNWTWVGREAGALPGTEAIITFGEKAVFGSIPNGDKPLLRLTTAAGRSWLVEIDAAAIARLHGSRHRAPDFRVPPRLANLPARVDLARAPSSPRSLAADAAATTNVDLVIGYTTGFASRLGGQSEAMTRLNFMVDVANQAYANSQVSAQLRLVRAVQVTYADATSNDQALYDATGVECTEVSGGLDCQYVGPPASLQPLHDAREEYDGDLVSLVRKFSDPENKSCGVAWLNGANQIGVQASDEITGFSVVSDSSGHLYPDPDQKTICSDEALAHELGHNMGSQHDRESAGSEYGAYAYSFGYRTSPGNGDFYTVMAYPETRAQPPYQLGYRVFSNPDVSFCGGRPCGVEGQADNARSLRQTIPVVASFRASNLPSADAVFDFNGDGVSDVLWRHGSTGANTIWLSARKSAQQAMTRVANLAWRMVGVGDVDADGRADVIWRNFSSGANTIWRSGNAATVRAMGGVASQSWKVVGVGDFNGDGAADLLWRHDSTGANTIWRSANKSDQQAMTTITNLSWQVVAVGDVNGDGRDDVIWRHATTGANSVWYSGNYATRENLSAVRNLAWRVSGAGDFDGDGIDDILWRNISSGANTIWKAGNASTVQAMTGVSNLDWQIDGVGDFDGNGVDDVLWRNQATGANTIWREARSSSRLAMSPVAGQGWQIQP